MSLNIYSQPYDDDRLHFNKNTGHYELEFEYVKENFESTFRDDGVLKKRITRNSRKIYNYLFYRCYSSNRAIVNFCLNRTVEGRRYLFDIMVEQMDADLQSGYNDLSLQPGVNLATGSAAPREELQKNEISIDAEQIIDSANSYFGFNLLVQTLLPRELFLLVLQNEKRN